MSRRALLSVLLLSLAATNALRAPPIATFHATTHPRLTIDAITMKAAQPITSRSLTGLATFGATAGPLVDAVHNQVLLQYDVFPITIALFNAKTSLLIPPLLALTYALLGSVLPSLTERFLVGDGRLLTPPTASFQPRARAALAVVSTIGIIKLSEILTLAPLSANLSVGVLLACCLVQWLVIDAAWASLSLACVVAIGGPLAEIPFLGLGCWHYVAPDYFPLGAGANAWAGLNYVTAPCYFAVTTDAIAIGRWLSSSENSE